MNLKLLSLLAMIFSTQHVTAQAPNLTWSGQWANTHNYDIPDYSGLEKGQLVTHGDDYYIAGELYARYDVDPSPSDSAIVVPDTTAGSFVVVKYNGQNQLQWSIQLAQVTEANSSYVPEITVDDDGAVYVAAPLAGTLDVDPGPAVHSITGLGPTMFLAKYDGANGAFQWVKVLSGQGAHLYPLNLAYDGSASEIALFFNYTVSVDLDSDQLSSADSLYTGTWVPITQNACIARYSTAGQFLSAWQLGTGVQGAKMGLDNSGNVYMAAWIEGAIEADLDPDADDSLYTTTMLPGGFLAKYTAGSLQWVKRHDCAGSGATFALEVSPQGDVAMNGFTGFSPDPIVIGDSILPPGISPPYYLAVFTNAGDVQWWRTAQVAHLEFHQGRLLMPGTFVGSIDLEPETPDLLGMFSDTMEVGFLAQYDIGTGGLLQADRLVRGYDPADWSGLGRPHIAITSSDSLVWVQSFGGTVTLSPDLSPTVYEGVLERVHLIMAKFYPISTGLAVEETETHSFLDIFPNPFTSSTTMALRSATIASITIFDAPGHQVRAFDRSRRGLTTWDGRTTSGTEVPPGMYLVTVIADGQRYTQRVVKQ